MARITDLSLITGEPKQVRLSPDGPVYKLPADIPIPVYLMVGRLADLGDDADESAAIEEFYDRLLEMFQVYQPDLDSLPIGVQAMAELIPRVYGEEGEEEPRPTKAGTRSTSKKRTTKSRS